MSNQTARCCVVVFFSAAVLLFGGCEKRVKGKAASDQPLSSNTETKTLEGRLPPNDKHRIEELIAGNLAWRHNHPVSKSSFIQISGGTEMNGSYYLDLSDKTHQSPREVLVSTSRFGNLNMRTRFLKDRSGAYVFLDEQVFVKLDNSSLQMLEPTGFWATKTVDETITALTEILNIEGLTTRSVDGVTYTGIRLVRSRSKWNAYRDKIIGRVINDVPRDTPDSLVLYFGPSGEIHGITSMLPKRMNCEVIFYNWTDLPANAAELENACRKPNASQQQWDMPIDQAMVKYMSGYSR